MYSAIKSATASKSGVPTSLRLPTSLSAASISASKITLDIAFFSSVISIIPLQSLLVLPHLLPGALVAVDRAQKPQSLEALRLETVVEEHGVFRCSGDLDSVALEGKGYVVEAVLEELRRVRILTHTLDIVPDLTLKRRRRPVISTQSAWVIERDDDSSMR